jgi:hypothetical protein
MLKEDLMEKIRTRFGDGSPVELSADEVRRDLDQGTRMAADDLQQGRLNCLGGQNQAH